MGPRGRVREYEIRDVLHALKTEKVFDWTFWIDVTLQILAKAVLRHCGVVLVATAVAMILGIGAASFFILLPVVAKPLSLFWWWNLCFGLFLLANVLFNYWMAAFTPPGSPACPPLRAAPSPCSGPGSSPGSGAVSGFGDGDGGGGTSSSSNSGGDENNNGESISVSVSVSAGAGAEVGVGVGAWAWAEHCKKCNTARPLRAHHCSICNSCACVCVFVSFVRPSLLLSFSPYLLSSFLSRSHGPMLPLTIPLSAPALPSPSLPSPPLPCPAPRRAENGPPLPLDQQLRGPGQLPLFLPHSALRLCRHLVHCRCAGPARAGLGLSAGRGVCAIEGQRRGPGAEASVG